MVWVLILLLRKYVLLLRKYGPCHIPILIFVVVDAVGVVPFTLFAYYLLLHTNYKYKLQI